MDSLDANGFVRWIQSGHSCLKQHVEAVNALNVFPVPDGDTGTNMELSLAAGVRAMACRTDGTLFEVIQSLNQGLLMGARGNSGVILSQLMRGFLRLNPSLQTLTASDIALALQEGVQVAYKAVSKPVEGTILTVARDAAQTAVREARFARDLHAWFAQVVAAAQESLARTPSLLPVLQEANVVDSGGQGLVFIFEGFLRSFGGAADDADARDDGNAHAPARGVPSGWTTLAASHIAPHDGHFGYCTEALVRLGAQHPARPEKWMRSALESYCDSMLVVQADELLKLHVHTLHPGRVLEEALNVGVLLQVKIENMTEQHAALHAHPLPEPGRGTTDSHPGGATERTFGASAAAPAAPVTVVAVASGEGFHEAFRTLGATRVVDGGPTMNPCTEDIAAAIDSTGSPVVIVLPNHKNVLPSAEQALQVAQAQGHVLPTQNLAEGIAAMVAFQADKSVAENLDIMQRAAAAVVCGQVVRASREAVYQGCEIRPGQYLGLKGSQLVTVGQDRDEVAHAVIGQLVTPDMELLTLFYGLDVSPPCAQALVEKIRLDWDLDVECTAGGQPIYDYIFSVE